jgi:hypothetical protein
MTIQTEMEVSSYINATEPLEDRLEDVYNNILQIIDGFQQSSRFGSPEEYIKAKHLIANNIYLLYERLYLNIVREIDYTDIKHFAINNNEFVKYIFRNHFPEFSLELLDRWTQVQIDILECAMYRSNNRLNKHIFH